MTKAQASGDKKQSKLVKLSNGQPKPKTKKIRVIFVCTGNTCRSPMAEYIFKDYLKKIKKASLYQVSSRGLDAVENQPIHLYAQKVMSYHGISAKNHRAHALTLKEAQKADALVCMTESHKNALKAFPSALTLASLAGGKDVSDPYGGSEQDYARTFDYLLYSCEDLYSYLQKMERKDS